MASHITDFIKRRQISATPAAPFTGAEITALTDLNRLQRELAAAPH